MEFHPGLPADSMSVRWIAAFTADYWWNSAAYCNTGLQSHASIAATDGSELRGNRTAGLSVRVLLPAEGTDEWHDYATTPDVQ